MFNTKTGALVLYTVLSHISEILASILTNQCTHTRHVCTLLNVFLMMILDIIMTFQNFVKYFTYSTVCSAHAVPADAAWSETSLGGLADIFGLVGVQNVGNTVKWEVGHLM